jgi:HTH-type transcriptional regulator / antitoxin HigA
MPEQRASALRYQPDYAIAPGATLRSTLEARRMTQSELATRAGLSLKHVNQVIHGTAPVTPETALALEKVTGVSARTWNMLEANYRERLVRQKDRKNLASDEEWLKSLPIKELQRRDLLPVGVDRGTLLEEVCRFFGVANRESWEQVWRSPLASFRKSPAFKSDDAAMAAWLRIGELRASDVECKPYDAQRFREALRRIRVLTKEVPENFEPEVVRLCAESGVAVVFVPELPGTHVSGAARWLTPKRALIQLSLRHKSDDHLWFSLFHEAGHILLHSKKETFITAKNLSDEAEDEANDFAASLLIPKRFEPELRELRSLAEIQAFANRLDIAPGIVVGRLQREEILKWSQGNRLKRQFRFAEEDG